MAKTAPKTDALTTAQSQALARPDFIKSGDLTGTEDIGLNDLRLPRLAIAQGLSDQLIDGSSNYIPELKMFDLFNDLTGRVYGRGPIQFVPLRRDVRRIEFTPREEGGGILDLDVPVGDPRTQWTMENGVRVPPRATKFVEFVVYLLLDDGPEPIVFSIKDTNKWNRRAAERLTSFIKLRQAPIYAGVYTVESKPEKNDKGTFGVPIVQNAGFIQDEALYRRCEAFAASIAGKNIVTNREPGSDDDAFDTGEMDRERPEM